MNDIVKSSSFSIVPAENNSWEAVRYWVGLSMRLKQADLVCQVMAGFALRELRAGHANPGRRTDLVGPGESDKPGFWDLCKKEVGISDDTARNWMRMADGIRAKWKRLGVREQVAALMAVLPSQWTEPQVKLIEEAVHKVTDGRTQLEFMWEIGVARGRPGAVGRRPGEGGRRALSLHERAELLKASAEADWQVLDKGLRHYGAKFTALTDAANDAQEATIELVLNARRAWRKQPRDARDVAAIERMFR